MRERSGRLVGVIAASMVMALVAAPAAADVVTVGDAEVDEVTWSTADTRGDGTFEFTTLVGGTLGESAAVLSTPTGDDKVQLLSTVADGVALDDVTTLGYSTYRISALSSGDPNTVPSINLRVDLDDDGEVDAYMIYEPYRDTDNAVMSDEWQTWDALDVEDEGWWLSSVESGCNQGARCSFEDIIDAFPDARILEDPNAEINSTDAPTDDLVGSFGVNLGSGNGGIVGAVDGLYLRAEPGSESESGIAIDVEVDFGTPLTLTDRLITGDDQLGWVFNRDQDTMSPYEIAEGPAVLGDGAIQVAPVRNDINGNADKFIVEFGGDLPGEGDIPVDEFTSISVDYQLDLEDPATVNDVNQIYFNVYAIGPETGQTFGDCVYNYVAQTGSTSEFTTLTARSVDDASSLRDRTEFGCPSSLAAMPAGSTINFIAVNVGDTSANDQGVGAAFDNAVLTLDDSRTTYDFDPSNPAPVSGPTGPGEAEQEPDEAPAPELQQARSEPCRANASSTFTDVVGAFEADIACLERLGVARGDDGNFRPSDSINRGEAVALLGRLVESFGLDLPQPGPDDQFEDTGALFGELIAGMSAAGIIDGFDAGEFRPDGRLTRGQMAKVLLLSYEFALDTRAPVDVPDAFSDDDGTLFEDFINRAAALDLVDGDELGAFDAFSPITRGELARLLANLNDVVAEAAADQAA